jgi:hypothetical protein
VDGDTQRRGEDAGGAENRDPAPGSGRRPTLDTAVRRRRADRAFSLRLATALRQNERALERLKR